MDRLLPGRSSKPDLGCSEPGEVVEDVPMSCFRLMGGSPSVPTFRLIRSQSLWQQLGNPWRDWEMSIFAFSLCNKSGEGSFRKCLCSCWKTGWVFSPLFIMFLWDSWTLSSFAIRTRWFEGPCLVWQLQKYGQSPWTLGFTVETRWRKCPIRLPGEVKSALKFRLIRSWTFRQQLGEYCNQISFKRKLGDGHFRLFHVHWTWRGCPKVVLVFFVCYSPVGLWNSNLTCCQSWVILLSVPQVTALKVGTLHVWPKPFASPGEAVSFLLNGMVLCLGQRSWWERVSVFPTHFSVGIFFICLMRRSHSTSFWIFLREKWSMYSCIFSASVGG